MNRVTMAKKLLLLSTVVCACNLKLSFCRSVSAAGVLMTTTIYATQDATTADMVVFEATTDLSSEPCSDHDSKAPYPTTDLPTRDVAAGNEDEEFLSSVTDYYDNITDGLEKDSGWEWSTLNWTWYIILQLISAIVGTLGNLLVIVIIFQRRSSARSTDILIGSLAIADFFTSVFVVPTPRPTSVPNSWRGLMYCLIWHPDIPLWTSIAASSYILMAISIERFIAVVYPLHFSQIVTMRRVNIAIAVIWLMALLSLSFSFFVLKVDESSHQCAFTITTAEGFAAIGYFWFCIRIIVPVMTMLVTQTLIAVHLTIQSSVFKRGETSASTSFHIVARNRVLGMMFVVIIIYIICWTPNQVAFLGFLVGFVPPTYIGSPLHHIFTVLGFYNSCANPFIYLARNPEFRVALKEFFTGSTDRTTSVFGQRGNPSPRGPGTGSSRKTTDTRINNI